MTGSRRLLCTALNARCHGECECCVEGMLSNLSKCAPHPVKAPLTQGGDSTPSSCLFSLTAASFYGDGFIHLQTEELSNRNYLHLRFRTASQSGLLFLASGGGDFLLLEIISGRLQVPIYH